MERQKTEVKHDIILQIVKEKSNGSHAIFIHVDDLGRTLFYTYIEKLTESDINRLSKEKKYLNEND